MGGGGLSERMAFAFQTFQQFHRFQMFGTTGTSGTIGTDFNNEDK